MAHGSMVSRAASIWRPSTNATSVKSIMNYTSVMLFLLVLALRLEPLNSYSLELRNRNIANITIVRDAGTGATTGFRFVRKDKSPVTTLGVDMVDGATEFDISSNRLTAIPVELIQAMIKVKRIVLSKNPIDSFEPRTFYRLPELQEIVMEKSLLGDFPTEFIQECPKLKRVQINSSYVHTIPSRSIANLPSLEVFDLSRNNVTNITDDSFYNLPTIHTLDLSYNNLTGVPTGVFKLSPGWRVLDFRRNNISAAPSGLKEAVVTGWVSFERNIWVEIHEEEFANASQINELNVRSMGIFTVNSRAFRGMTSLKKLDLGDNVISVLAPDAFEGLPSLEVLSLKENNLRQVTFNSLPPKLKHLGLESNQIDEMPQLGEGVNASSIRLLNMSHNWLWKVETGSELLRYDNLIELDLSWNRLTNFTSGAFDPINKTIQKIYLDYNEIQSVPRTAFITLFQHNRTTISLAANPGIGTSADVKFRSVCPGGSVFESIENPLTNKPSLYGCIQCGIGTYHDNVTNTCKSCQGVSERAYTAVDGSTTCMYCPHSSDLHLNREQCKPFACNAYCWLTIAVGLFFPVIIMGSKCILSGAARSRKKTSQETLEEQEEMDHWVVDQLIRQVENARAGTGGDGGDEPGTMDEGKIYDLPKETQTSVLYTLQENFFQRRAKKRQQAAEARASSSGDDSSMWDDLEWESFEMSRILSRNYHGEIFLGNYDGTQVVVKRMMTLRFDVRELFDTIREVEMMLSFRHENIVQYLGTIWSDVEYFCVICEYVPSGDVRALLELEAANAPGGSSRPQLVSQSSSQTAYLTSGTSVSDASMPSLSWIPTRLQLTCDIVNALAHVHGLGVFHRDLRSRNVLVTETYRAKLNDFRRNVNDKYFDTTISISSLATNLGSSGGGLGSEDDSAVSLPVIAPEVVLKNDFQASSDVYACGILLAELWCHRHVTFSITNVPGVERGSASSTLHSDMSTSGELDSIRRQELYRVDDEKVRRFMRQLRASVDKSSAVGSGSSSGESAMAAMITEKVLRIVEDCLLRDPRKRPSAQTLSEMFSQLHQGALTTAAKIEQRRGDIVHM